MTPSSRLPLRHWARGALAAVLLTAVACVDRSADKAPRAEFIIAAGDSTYWVTSDGAAKLRGSPMVLARLEGKFLELYVVDDDDAYENALFISQRLYRRDLITGDSTEIFHDTLVAGLAERYQRQHPTARRIDPDDENQDEPANEATADLSVLGVHGPFLSLEYHVDTTVANNDVWHMTRHVVIDLRNGREVTLADVLGPAQATAVLSRARALYRETVDSVRHDTRPSAKRAAQVIEHFHFDPRSFALTSPNGALMIAFSAPGQGIGGEGFVLPMRPIAVAEPAWWADAKDGLPTATREREELWNRGSYTVKAVYDTSDKPVRLALVDTAGKEFTVGGIAAPVHRIYWLDRPPLDRATRSALAKAFDEAAAYDDQARTVSTDKAAPPIVLARR